MSIRRTIYAEFARQWDLSEETVEMIHRMILNSENRYSLVSRTLLDFHIEIPSRRLKYFARKIVLSERYGPDIANKRDLIDRRS